MDKPVLQKIFEDSIKELTDYLRVQCPNCKEKYDLFTSEGVLPPLKDCKTGRCIKCKTDFYYRKGSCWYETFTIENIPKDLKGELDEKTIQNAANHVYDSFHKS